MENLSFVQTVQELQVRGSCSDVQGGDGCSYRTALLLPVPGLLPGAGQGAGTPLASALQLALHR